jgi:hypothetical protein
MDRIAKAAQHFESLITFEELPTSEKAFEPANQIRQSAQYKGGQHVG